MEFNCEVKIVDNEILVKALNDNYNVTLDNMIKGDRNTQIFLRDENAYNQVYQLLRKNNFVLDKDNGNLLFLNPVFLISSLA